MDTVPFRDRVHSLLEADLPSGDSVIDEGRAMAVMAALRKRGTLIHSYLEDGFGAHFHDCATIAAWAVLERYIVEDLLGGKLAHCIGGLTCDPVKRAGWVFALDAIHDHDCVGSMFYGDTLSFTQNPAINQSVVAEYLIWDVLAQLECPTGHALLPIPVTEAIRVPSDEEIAEIQHFGQRMERAARTLQPHVDLSASRRFADQAVSMGKTVAVRALDGLKEVGVDVKDPVQLLYVMKGLGPAVFELNFGAGEIDEAFSHGRKPVLPTDVYEMSRRYLEEHREHFAQPRMREVFRGRRLIIASTDVHEFAIEIIHRLLSEAGAEMINLGAEMNPEEIVDAAVHENADGILLSTHNGMALDYGKRLKETMSDRKNDIPIFMGGILNQKLIDEALPVDVSEDLKALGFHACK